MDLDNIQPMIVPRDVAENGLTLPHLSLKNRDFVVCWVHVYEDSHTYIMKEEYEQLDHFNPEWKRIAVENLRKGEFFHRYNRLNDNGELIWICFMNDLDTISSSKILLSPELEKIFPEGYWLAAPNSVTGLAISKKCSKQELNEVQKLITSTYGMHPVPIVNTLLEPDDIRLPDELVNPIDQELSDYLVTYTLKGGD